MGDIKQRAVNPAQKQQRIAQILAAAEQRLLTANFSDVRIVDIAGDVGITKAAFYRYFRNKEVLFLALYEYQIDALSVSTQQYLIQTDFVTAVTKAICQQPMYCKLTSILHTILEQNITTEEAVQFKLTMMHKMSSMVALFTPYLTLSSEQLINRFFMLHHAIIGAWANCQPSDVVKEAFAAHQELALFDLPFESMLHAHIALLFVNDLKH